MINVSLKPVCTFCNVLLSMKLIENIEYNGKAYDIYFCNKCLIGTLSPMLSLNEVVELYSLNGYRSTSGVKFNKLFERLIYMLRLQRKRRIKKYIKRGHILDLGCGRGLFLSIMKKDNWYVTGVEFNEETASYALSAYNIDVKTGNPSEWGLLNESFDVITINHAIEHTQYPAEILSACRRLLRKGGLLVIAAPNIDSLQSAVGKGAWFHIDVAYHLYHFSEKGLVSLLKKRSFTISKIRRFDIEYNPFGWLQTLLNISGIKKNLLYSLLKSPELRKSKFTRTKRTDLMITFLLLPVYTPLAFMLSVFESFILKRGGTFEIYAIKE